MGSVTLALAPLLVFAVAVAAAVVAGVATYALMSAGRESEGFAALGWALLGALVGIIVALVVTVVGLIVLARRLFLPGHRAAPVVLALVGPLVPLVLSGVINALASSKVAPVLVSALTLVALATPSLAFLWCGSAAPTRSTLQRGGGVLAAVVVVGSLVAYVVSDAREDEAVDALPLVLFDGTRADEPFPGWRRDPFSTTIVRAGTGFAPGGHEAYLKYFAAPGVAFITMRTDIGDCSPTLLRGYTCQVVGTLPAGELRSYRSPKQYATYPESLEFLVLVYGDGSGVSVNVDGSQQPAQDVLARLQRVDRETFEAATDAELSIR